jgi:hypothetical protein
VFAAATVASPKAATYGKIRFWHREKGRNRIMVLIIRAGGMERKISDQLNGLVYEALMKLGR